MQHACPGPILSLFSASTRRSLLQPPPLLPAWRAKPGQFSFRVFQARLHRPPGPSQHSSFFPAPSKNPDSTTFSRTRHSSSHHACPTVRSMLIWTPTTTLEYVRGQWGRGQEFLGRWASPHWAIRFAFRGGRRHFRARGSSQFTEGPCNNNQQDYCYSTACRMTMLRIPFRLRPKHLELSATALFKPFVGMQLMPRHASFSHPMANLQMNHSARSCLKETENSTSAFRLAYTVQGTLCSKLCFLAPLSWVPLLPTSRHSVYTPSMEETGDPCVRIQSTRGNRW
ncbi:hypothetical protein CABS01_03241 [Colletotrichum abscissum]|uniref:uncharacterized protein n=1 Tax=Colletotrichum abscissum TaxID=1671311 RepID=UPI0027D63FC0|nr:uncharacterized protein CABS01_03241 [Colletotrichum abscissum]KAK1477939.1 hypothetical protein CABS01_03241 [Colletotrichum abscissum]